MKKLAKKMMAAGGLALMLAGSGTASAVPMELALVLDGSGSISSSDWLKQLNGYKSVFTSGSFYDNFVAPSPYDSLLVSAYQFSTGVVQEIGWTLITNNAQATAFGNQFNTSVFAQMGGWTNTEGALQAAVNGLLSNGTTGGKMVIDISTDGQPTVCNGGTSSSSTNCAPGQNPDSEALAAANFARDNGIIVNALGVGSIDQTYLKRLVGINPVDTPQGFFLVANTYDDFASTLETKLGREIKGSEIPEPATMLLFAAGLFGLAFARKRA